MTRRGGMALLVAMLLAVLVGFSATGAAQAQGGHEGHGAAGTRAARDGWPFRGDPALRPALIAATVDATGLRRGQVQRQLRQGSSLAEIAEAQGSSQAEVLASFDERLQGHFERRAEGDEMPESLAAARVRWFSAAARQMMAQPSLRPAYPGLHELHVALIGAATRISDLPRTDIRKELTACRTLDDILAEAGHSGQDAVDEAMSRITSGLDSLVANDTLTEAQRSAWRTAIEAALTSMVATPGVHVAGEECAPQDEGR